MLIRRSARALIASAATLAAALMSAGCGGLSAGDYVTYRVAFDSTKPSATCYPNGEIPEEIKDDKTTFKSGATFIVYVASDDEALLDTGDIVLTGTIDGDAYSFSGKVTDVDHPPGNVIYDSDHDGIPDNTDTMIDADHDGLDDQGADNSVDVDADGLDDRCEDNLVDANLDGEDDRYVEQPSDTTFTDTLTLTIEMTVDGESVSGTSKSKEAQTCTGSLCPTGYDVSCTRTTKFKGVEIEETDPDFGSNSGSSSP